MKVKLNLTTKTIEYLDTKPYIQGTDARNKLIVYSPNALDGIQICYQLQNGRNTIKLSNTGVLPITDPDYVEDYTAYYFDAPSTLTSLAGNFMASLIVDDGETITKFNIMNTVLNSVYFEAFEDAVSDADAEFLEEIESLAAGLNTKVNIADVIDDLTHTNTNKPLSANQGKILKGLLDTEITNRIADVDAEENRATLAESGLQSQITTNANDIDTLEGKIGVIVITGSATSGTLTDEQAAELSKNYCVIKYSNAFYYKRNSNNAATTYDFYQLAKELTSASDNAYTYQVEKISVSYNNSDSKYHWNKTSNGFSLYLIGAVNSKVYTLQNNINASGHAIDLTIDSDYKLQAILKDSNNNTISSSSVIDLPLESVVVSGAYDDTTKKVVLTLEDGSTIDFSVADLINGLQSEITSDNKLSSDLVDDTNHTHKFVSAAEKAQITTNQNAISGIKDGASIDSFGDVETALSGKADKSDTYTKQQVDDAIAAAGSEGITVNWNTLCTIFDSVYTNDPTWEDIVGGGNE